MDCNIIFTLVRIISWILIIVGGGVVGYLGLRIPIPQPIGAIISGILGAIGVHVAGLVFLRSLLIRLLSFLLGVGECQS